MAPAFTMAAFTRVAQIASDRRVHRALQWLHLHEQQIMKWQMEVTGIPSPPFGERPRAEWLCARFRELGLEDVRLDGIGNALGVRRGAQPAERGLLVSAHIDTVFPAETVIKPFLKDTLLQAPGACDNGAGVVCLLAIAAALRHAEVVPARNLIFCGNVGEEGEGNLRGVRFLYEQEKIGERIAAHLVVDGAGHESAVTEALGSRRFQVALKGPGGHSWSDAGNPNPIVALSRAIARLSEVDLSAGPRTTMNVATIEGGTAVNVVPDCASARFDFRSTDSEQLIRVEVELHRAVEDAVMAANEARRSGRRQSKGLEFSIKKIGERPAGALPNEAAIYRMLRAVDRHLGIRTEARTASTDANIPLSRGVQALSVGAGGTGGGIHTPQEWYDAKDRESGLRRVLLLTLALAGEDCC